MLTPDSILGTLIDRLFVDIDYLEVLMTLPDYSWSDIIITLGLITVWKLFCDQLDRLIFARLRRWLIAFPFPRL